MSIPKFVRNLNEGVAVLATRCFGTMWMFYILVCYGMLPVLSVFRPHQDTLLYWSNFIQLVALPLIMVGTNILGRESERRAKEDHERLAKTYHEQVETNKQVVQSVQMIQQVIEGNAEEETALQVITSKLDELRRRYDLLMPAANRAFQDKYCDCDKADDR